MARSSLSGSVGIGQVQPSAEVEPVPGQISPGGSEGNQRRRDPPPEEPPVDRPAEDAAVIEEAETEETDPSPHRIDSLA